MLWLFVLVALIVVVGLWLAGVAERSDARWRPLVRQLVAQAATRELTALVADHHLVLTTRLRPAGLPYPTAARVLSRGPLLAMLHQLGVESSPSGELTARRPLRGVGAPTVRAEVQAFVTLADALEALPMAEAMARRFVDLPAETSTPDRLAAFEALLQWHPRAADTLRLCESEAAHGEDPGVQAAARRHLAALYVSRSP